jgi:hypothetical protein
MSCKPSGGPLDRVRAAMVRRVFMRPVLLPALLATLVIGLAPGLANAVPPQDRAFGTGTFGGEGVPPGQTFDFDARSDPFGANATGHFAFDFTTFDIQGKVTCLAVAGDTATIGGEITKSDRPAFAGLSATFTVVDGGPNGAGDTISFIGIAPGEATCVPQAPVLPVEDGDIVVQDAECDTVNPDKPGKCKDKKEKQGGVSLPTPPVPAPVP